MQEQQGTADAAKRLLVAGAGVGRPHRVDHRRRRGLQRPGDHVLHLLGGVALVDAIAVEPLGEAAKILAHVVGVVAMPAVIGVAPLLEVDVAVFVARTERACRRNEHGARDPLRPLGRHQGGQVPRQAAAHDHRPVGPARVHHRPGVGDEPVIAVVFGSPWPVRLAVAARVVGQHAIVPGEEGDLGLPRARMNDLPRWKQEDRRLASRRRPRSAARRPPFRARPSSSG